MKLETILKKDFSIYNQRTLNRLYKRKIDLSNIGCYICYIRSGGKTDTGCNGRSAFDKEKKNKNWKQLRKTQWKEK
jgi:hypothetical protein